MLFVRPTPKFEIPWLPTADGLCSGDTAAGRQLRFPKSPPLLKLKPGAAFAGNDRRGRAPEAVVLVVVCRLLRMLRSKSTESCRPSSMPNSLVLPKSIDAIITWIMTMGGRASSCSMIPRTSSKYLGVALRTRLLVTGSATTTTSRSICSNALVSPARPVEGLSAPW